MDVCPHNSPDSNGNGTLGYRSIEQVQPQTSVASMCESPTGYRSDGHDKKSKLSFGTTNVSIINHSRISILTLLAYYKAAEHQKSE